MRKNEEIERVKEKEREEKEEIEKVKGNEREKEKEREKKDREDGRGKKCYFFKKEKCTRENCKFRHPKEVCKKYTKNECHHEIYCYWSHPGKGSHLEQDNNLESILKTIREGFKITNTTIIGIGSAPSANLIDL